MLIALPWNGKTRAFARLALTAGVLSGGAAQVSAQATYYTPPLEGHVDYQLGGRYAAPADVSIVSSDAGIRLDGSTPNEPALDPSRYNICYLNVLQTQPQDAQYWLDNYPQLILSDEQGPIHDPDDEWAEEMLFDVSTQEKQDALFALQATWITHCKNAGFQAIEPDNLDAASRSQGLLDDSYVQYYMARFVAEAHRQGLAVAQKNVTEWLDTDANGEVPAASIGFDFAILEECQLNDGDCDTAIAYYGASNVIEIEYWYDTDDASSGAEVPAHTRDHFDAACEARGDQIRIVIRNRDVRPATAPDYYRATCDETATPEEPID